MSSIKEQALLSPRLLADVGGTNARFALERAPQQFEAVQVLPCQAFASLQDAMTAYLALPEVQAACAGRIQHAALAIANPVDGDVVRMTNHHWTFSIEAVRTALGLDTLLVVNDFTALAMALPRLSPGQRIQIGGGQALPDRPIALIGPGTGLGVSGILPTPEGGWLPLASEGGHVSFAPVDKVEMEILRRAWLMYEHVSAERLISGMGLELLHALMQEMDGVAEPVILSAAEISAQAGRDACVYCTQAVERFCAMLGSVAGNLAMTLGAAGGVYVGGGIVPKLGPLFLRSPFRQRFEAKGRFKEYLAPIPTYMIVAEYPAFLGVSAILSEHVQHKQEQEE